MKLRILLMLAFVGLFCCGITDAQIPRKLNYQGYLTTSTGAPVNTPQTLIVRVYDASSSGTALFTEIHTPVTVSNGIFNILLGSVDTNVNPLNLSFSTQYYLGVTVGTDAEMAPRQPLAASPYAIRAASAEALATSAVVPGTQLADASVTAAKLASNGCAGGQVLQYNGSVWVCATPAASSGGTVTSVTAGTGLTGGTITGSGTIGADTNVLQRRVVATCAVGSSIRAIADDGSVTCQLDAIGAGTVTSVATGAGLTGGPITSSGTVNLASTQLLPTLACAADQTVKWNGSMWACATTGAPAAFVAAPQDTVITAIDNTGLVGWYSAITVAPDGLPVISYQDRTNADLKVAKCGNPACTAGNTITAVDTTGIVGEFTSITIGADGLPVISYYDATNGDLKVTKCGNAACTAGNTVTAVDTGGNVGRFTSIAIGADGLPVISYYNATNGDLKVAKCGNASCSAGNTLNTVDTSASVVSTSIAVGLDGLPVISYIVSATLLVLKCGDAACSPALLKPRNLLANGVGSSIAMTIGSDGYPAISFYNQTAGDLVLAHCAGQDCYRNPSTGATGTSLVNVDTLGDVGQFTSLSIGADGMPVMSYIDTTNRILKFAKCDNVDCSGAIWLRAIGSVGNVSPGHSTSIAIGADGTPVISFHETTAAGAGALKVAKCSNAFCAPFFRRR